MASELEASPFKMLGKPSAAFKYLHTCSIPHAIKVPPNRFGSLRWAELRVRGNVQHSQVSITLRILADYEGCITYDLGCVGETPT